MSVGGVCSGLTSSAERHQIMQMASKKIELERRIRALRVKGDEVRWKSSCCINTDPSACRTNGVWDTSKSTRQSGPTLETYRHAARA